MLSEIPVQDDGKDDPEINFEEEIFFTVLFCVFVFSTGLGSLWGTTSILFVGTSLSLSDGTLDSKRSFVFSVGLKWFVMSFRTFF